jgi:alpha-L-arabinofuranosidase
VSNCGLSCEFRHGDFQPAEKLDEFIQDGLDAVEYALGPVDSKWGAQRAANGHPQPFPLQYFQIGNENHGPRYKDYYQRIYKVMKEKYPQLQYVYCCGCGWADEGMVKGAGKIELADEHFYRAPDWFFNEYRRYDQTPRDRGFDLYVGEYACNSQVGQGNMLAALSEAAFMLGMERNGDIVKMTSYAPLLFNVNRLDWPVNMIGYDSSRSFGRSSYHVQKLFSVNRPDVNLTTELAMAADEAGGPRFAGKIGLGAWDTDAEYKDLVVERDGKAVYTSNFAANTEDWKAHTGSSASVAEGAYRLTGSVPRRFALLEGREFDTFTLKVKARKIKGGEGFLILFGAKGPQEFHELNLGGWGNREHAFESVQNGEGTPHGSKARGQIDPDRWYDIKLVVNANEAIGYLGAKEVVRYTFASEPRVYAQAGYDKQAGEVVVKAVNATAQAVPLQVKLEGGAPAKEGRLILLAASKPGDENDVDSPTRITPKESTMAIPGPEFPMNLEPWSLTVLRIPAKLP